MNRDEEQQPEVVAARGWPRAAALLGVVLALSVLRPGVLVAVPALMLLILRGRQTIAVVAAVLLGAWVVAAGPRESLWFVERAWGVLLGGWFVALTLLVPEWRLSSRALGAAASAACVAALYFATPLASWQALDWVVADGVHASVTSTIDALRLLREGRPMSPAFVAAMYEMAEAQAFVFPALVGLASAAALAVAWWAVVRISGGGDQAIGPIRDFRFNDHLVWVLIGGLILLVTRWGDALARVGANIAVFMGAIYAVRGAGVVMFVSGGLSMLAWALLVMGLFLAAPSVVGVAVLIGIADTWLDLRERVAPAA